jgi:hypothetical protein
MALHDISRRRNNSVAVGAIADIAGSVNGSVSVEPDPFQTFGGAGTTLLFGQYDAE